MKEGTSAVTSIELCISQPKMRNIGEEEKTSENGKQPARQKEVMRQIRLARQKEITRQIRLARQKEVKCRTRLTRQIETREIDPIRERTLRGEKDDNTDGIKELQQDRRNRLHQNQKVGKTEKEIEGKTRNIDQVEQDLDRQTETKTKICLMHMKKQRTRLT
jgi:hypothetical protein